ncbi:hypothetical protein E8E14_009391 [Neopestalotiopsis sp. 37M]|nr:hypothetical protein E8E14_009391 [Neopestalotiopsis sp. 37M]
MASRSRGLLVVTTFATTVAADGGDDFANNLFSDLAPLLALFGERVTMQFMSQSLGWADNIILAMAPLGIITIITSAIRVGGPSFLKALIGRARENLAVAEQELMSSTSKEVCELWNGHEVVRCMGSSPVTEFICILPRPQGEHGKDVSDLAIRQSQHAGSNHSPKITVMDLGDVLGKQLIQIDKIHTKDDLCGLEDGSNLTESSSPDIIITRNQHLDAPNISLNSHSQTNRVELRIVAILGTILQLGVLTFSACSVYHPVFSIGFQRDGNPVAAYAFPCHAAGTLILVVGMLLCAHVVESSTSEETFRPGSSLTAQLVWLQQAKTVNDQMFDSFAIFAKSERTIVTTSRRRGNQKTIQKKSDQPYSRLSDPSVSRQPEATQETAVDVAQPPRIDGHSDDSGTPSPKGELKPVLELEASLGTIIGLCGFIVQFVGLRGLHWSASIAQLGAVLLMAGLKAWVRRGLAESPSCQHVLPGFELDWFATTFADINHAPWRPNSNGRKAERWTLEPLGATKTKLNDESQTVCVSLARIAKVFIGISRGGYPTRRLESSLTEAENNTDPGQILSVRNHRIVGSKESFRVSGEQTIFEVEDLPEPRFGPDDDEESEDSDSENEEHDVGDSTAAQRKETHNQDLLAVEFNGSLISLFAQDIFSSFLMAAARTPERSPFTEPAEIQHNDTSSSQAWQSFTLRSDQLMKLARTIQSTGLGGLDDIYLSMIPSLSAENKLPQVTRVIDLTRQHAEPHEKLQRWDEASDAYLWLFRVAKTFPKDSEFVAQAVAILVEFLRQVNSALELCETLEDELRKTLEPLKKKIESELCSSDEIQMIFDRLLNLYTTQQRPWEAKVVSQATEHVFPGTFNFTQMHRKVLKMHEYAYFYDAEDIKKDKTDLNTKDVLGWIPLNYAVQRQMEIEKLFSTTKSGLAVTSQDLLGHTPLHYACGTKHEDQSAQSNIQTLLQWGAEINAQGRDGVAPIHCAAKNGNLQAMRFLVESGANIDIQDASGKTPLLWSVISKDQDTVKYLWENSNTKLRDGEGRTALHLAVVFADDETVAWLLENGADARAVDRSTRTPLHQIGQSGRVGLEVMSLLCQKYDADVDAKDGFHQTALHLAALRGHKAVVEWLVQEAGADMNAKDRFDRTALHLAALKGHKAVVEWLVQEAGADVNAKDRFDRTALHVAALKGNKAVVEWLVQEAGADITAKTDDGQTPSDLAALQGHEAVVKLLTKEAAVTVEARESVCDETVLSHPVVE